MPLPFYNFTSFIKWFTDVSVCFSGWNSASPRVIPSVLRDGLPFIVPARHTPLPLYRWIVLCAAIALFSVDACRQSPWPGLARYSLSTLQHATFQYNTKTIPFNSHLWGKFALFSIPSLNKSVNTESRFVYEKTL